MSFVLVENFLKPSSKCLLVCISTCTPRKIQNLSFLPWFCHILGDFRSFWQFSEMFVFCHCLVHFSLFLQFVKITYFKWTSYLLCLARPPSTLCLLSLVLVENFLKSSPKCLLACVSSGTSGKIQNRGFFCRKLLCVCCLFLQFLTLASCYIWFVTSLEYFSTFFYSSCI